jgi:alpha-galactosidase
MSIIFDADKQVFLLNTPGSTYVIRIFSGLYLLHGGWFRRITNWSDLCVPPVLDHSFSPNPAETYGQSVFSHDSQPSEYPSAGRGDFRMAALEADLQDGSNVLDLLYKTYRIIQGKPLLQGLPATYVCDENDADTLEIDLEDTKTGLVVTLCYTVWNTYDVICRHTVVQNRGEPVLLRRIMSTSIDFFGTRYKMLQLSGAHARERHVILRRIEPGLLGIDSRRAMSSHQQNPFIALLAQNADENNGEVFGFSFVYSGNFTAQVEADQFNMTRVQVGLNPDSFSWTLKSGESFCSPEVVMVRSENGLGGMSRIYHDLYRNNLCRGTWKTKERPIVINNWEATFFDFTPEKLFNLAASGVKSGMELFVLDDGWFGKRNNDHSSLGDWNVNEIKLQGGISAIADGMNKCGLGFGLWVEPEMISPDSDLYRLHPDWCIHIDGRSRTLGRNQCVLDLSRDEVVSYLEEVFIDVFSSADISYVKWDYNRCPTEVSQQISHMYILGLYRLLETLTTRFPYILFESCSGGGGRFDPGMLYYMPQTWASDNTDALSRVQIQMGTSIVYPACCMSCHVSIVPNQQTGRVTPLEQRAHVAMAGVFGYELDLTGLTDAELTQISEQVQLYKKIRHTVQFGDLYRLETPWSEKSPDEVTNYSAWENVAKDGSQIVLIVVWTYAESNVPPENIRLRGLDENMMYRVTESSVRKPNMYIPGEKGQLYGGAELMNAGLYISFIPECGQSVQIVLERA